MNAHSKLIKSLVTEIRRLRQEVDSAQGVAEEASNAAYYAEERASRARQEARYQEQEAQRAKEEAEYRDYQREQATRELERARQYGNEWEEERALRKLKDIY